jgi:four helix bundle protein
MRIVNHFSELETYQSAFRLQQEVFQISKSWPREESFALIDQIRRSSRSVGANLSEAWSKRMYPAHFLSKLTDSDGELQETSHWLSTAESCGYLTAEQMTRVREMLGSTGRQLGKMIGNYESFCFELKPKDRLTA